MQYTKGTWKVLPDIKGDLYSRDYIQSEWHRPQGDTLMIDICRIDTLNKDDANLISSAPDMYEALKNIINGIDGGKEIIGYGREVLIRKAIAKAEGKDA